MKRLIKKILLLLSPLIIITICYVITDPYQDMPFNKLHAFDITMLSRGDMSTKLYLRNFRKYHYDSFIFGSSRSTSHTSKEWGKYLPDKSIPFSFGAWNESIIGIYKRLRLIDSLNQPIKNVFILLDVDYAFHLKKLEWDHYLITGISKYEYYRNNYINYLQNPRLIVATIDYKIFQKQRAYMYRFVKMKKDDLDLINNDWASNSENEINSDSINYYKTASGKFYNRTAKQHFSNKQIDNAAKDYLYKIYFILKKHKTNYKIVIAPLYDQVKLNPYDFNILIKIFGSKNVFDYSGINNVTNNITNYNSDVIHYRKKVGNLIYKQIYN